MDANHIHAEAGDGWRRGLLVSLQSCGTVQYKSACHKCLLLGATDKIEKQIYFVAIKVFLCHLHSNRHVYAERLKEGGWGETGWRGWGRGNARKGRQGGVILTHNFLETEWGCLHKAKKGWWQEKILLPFISLCCIENVLRWGEGWSFRSHMAQNKQIKHKTWWGGELWLFQPPKVHAAQDEAKNGRSGSILAWMMDDGWWGGGQRNDKSDDNNKRKANENWKQPQQQNKESKSSPHPTLPGPKGKQKEDKNERKEKHKPSSWVQIDTEERCSYVHHTRKKGKETQHHVIQLFIRLEAEGEVGARNEDMNFCVHMMGCTVCLRKCVYVATIWGEGTVFSQQKLLALHLTALSLFFFFENTWVWGFNGLKRYKNK